MILLIVLVLLTLILILLIVLLLLSTVLIITHVVIPPCVFGCLRDNSMARISGFIPWMKQECAKVSEHNSGSHTAGRGSKTAGKNTQPAVFVHSLPNSLA